MRLDGAVVYLAAPLFTQAERQWNQGIADRLQARGVRVLLPQRDAAEYINKNGFDPKGLFDVAVGSIERADAVLAVFDGADPDSGTSFECGVAWKTGKPIVGLRTDLRAGGDTDESGGRKTGEAVNLMLSQGAQQFVFVDALKDPTLDDVADAAIAALETVLKGT